MRGHRAVGRQRGVALVLGLAMLLAGALAYAWLFDAGRVIDTKTRLVTAADAAAYSAAAWRARVLNYDAYANRAIVAQEVAIAQAVTLTSWARYFDNLVETVGTIVSTVFPVAAPFFAYASDVAQLAREATEDAAALETWARGVEGLGYKNLLAESQALLHLSAGTFGLGAVAAEIARANDRDFFAFALSDEGAFERLTRRYESDDDRDRLRRLVEASLDPFVRDRGFDDRLPVPSGCAGTSADVDAWTQWLRRRGGTVLAPALERWEAADTLAIHDYRRGGFLLGGCREQELMPLGWGAAEAGPQALDGALVGNPGDVQRSPRAAALAQDELSSSPPLTYSGIARVRELAYDALDDTRFPVSRVAVLARVDGARVRTSSVVGVNAGRLRLPGRYASGRLWALAVGEVYFRRPVQSPARIEYASLYSPYWQARLAEPSGDERALADEHVR